MPKIASFDGISVYIYYDDHNPPHFHAFYQDDEVQVEIGTIRVINGTLPKATLFKLLTWAELRKAKLALIWAQAQSGVTPEIGDDL